MSITHTHCTHTNNYTHSFEHLSNCYTFIHIHVRYIASILGLMTYTFVHTLIVSCSVVILCNVRVRPITSLQSLKSTLNF